MFLIEPLSLTVNLQAGAVDQEMQWLCAVNPLCCADIAPPAVCQLAESLTDPDGGWHTKAYHPVQRVASNLCFDLLTG